MNRGWVIPAEGKNILTNKKQTAGKRILTAQESNSDGPDAPHWYRSPQEQMEFVSRVWPKVPIPEPPKDFAPKRKGEVLLLHVPCSVSKLWDYIFEYQHDYIEGRENVESNWGTRFLSSIHANSYRTLPAWVAFDPDIELEKRVEDSYNKENIAGVEVLSAILQFPDLPFVWDNIGFGVCAAGCRDERDKLLGFYLSVHAHEVRVPGGLESAYCRKLEPVYISKSGSLVDEVAFPTVRRV